MITVIRRRSLSRGWGLRGLANGWVRVADGCGSPLKTRRFYHRECGPLSPHAPHSPTKQCVHTPYTHTQGCEQDIEVCAHWDGRTRAIVYTLLCTAEPCRPKQAHTVHTQKSTFASKMYIRNSASETSCTLCCNSVIRRKKILNITKIFASRITYVITLHTKFAFMIY